MSGKKKMIRTFALICFTIVYSIVCISALHLLRTAFANGFFAEPEIMQTEISPDGKYVAYVFESNGDGFIMYQYCMQIKN